jgi:uncharacterized protein DUF4365
MLSIPHCKESLSRAYVTAVVGRARHNIAWSREYDYKVDGTIKQLVKRGDKISETGFGVDFQAKTTVDWEHDNSEVIYDLEANTYNYLIERGGNGSQPCILVLLCLHKRDDQWLKISENVLELRNCIYWHQLTGDVTTNATSQRIRIPRSNLFTPTAVTEMMNKVAAGVKLL